MKRYLACECGYSVEGDDLTDLVARVRLHARRTHGVELSDEQIVWLIRPAAGAGDGADGHARPAETNAPATSDATLQTLQ